MEDEVSFGRWLRQRRRALDLTQDELAERVGYAVTTIRRIEADNLRPSKGLAERLAQALELGTAEGVAFVRFARTGQAEAIRPVPVAVTLAASADRRMGSGASLPMPPTPLIGRETELASLDTWLRHGPARLVTLTGPGGVGKTRLALEVARGLRNAFADGVFFIDLSPLLDPALVASTIAKGMGIAEESGRPALDSLKRALGEKQALVALDNFEQLVSAATLVAELLRDAPGVKVLITSRAPLHVRGEHEFDVPPLTLPDAEPGQALDTFIASAAVRLFVERAQATDAHFAITQANASTVASICRHLDGLPLAIELAAARIKTLPPDAILARLESRLGLLTGGPRDAPARHRTLRATLDWSYDLLDSAEQTLLRRLAVFVGGFTLPAAEAVCNAHGDLASVLHGVEALFDHSLVRRQSSSEGEARYTLLETVREYALERLAASGEEDPLRRQHAQFYLALAEAGELGLRGAEQAAWFKRLDHDHDNLRAALRWSTAGQDRETGLRLAGALTYYWCYRGYGHEGLSWLETALAHGATDRTSARAKALFGAGWMTLGQGDFARAQLLLEESVTLYRERDDRWGMAWTLRFLSRLLFDRGNAQAARSILRESQSLFREVGDKWGLAWTLGDEADDVYFELHDHLAARPLFEASIAFFFETGDNLHRATTASHLAWLHMELGNYKTARLCFEARETAYREMGLPRGSLSGTEWPAYLYLMEGEPERAGLLFVEALRLRQKDEQLIGIAHPLIGLAQVWRSRGDAARAARLLAFSNSMYETHGRHVLWVRPLHVIYDRSVVELRAQLGEDGFAVAWAEGRAMSLDQAIEEAIG